MTDMKRLVVVKRRNISAVGNMLNRYEQAVKDYSFKGTYPKSQHEAITNEYKNARDRIKKRLLEPYVEDGPELSRN